jgi:Protein of unknown function (DUF2809)
MFKFNRPYFIAAVLLFLIELFIALYVKDAIIRPYIGDLLVVILIYCIVKCCLNISVLSAAIGVLLFSYMVELLQYFNIVEVLHLQDSKFARVIIGTSFSWADMLAYTLGIGVVLVLEKVLANRQLAKAVTPS